MKPLFALFFLWSASLAAAPVVTDHAEAELVAEHTAWLPGAPNAVALRLKPQQGWHTYWRNPGDSGIPTKLEWTLPAGWKAGDIEWPYPEYHELGGLGNYGYGDETLHLVTLEVPAKAAGEQTVKAVAKWLVCADICVPGKAELSLTLPVKEIVTSDPMWSAAFADARKRLPSAEPLAATFQVENEDVRLQVKDAALDGAQRAEFFPFDGALVNHGAPQRSELAGGTLRLAQARSASFLNAPERVEGVLVVHGADTRAYTIEAQPGTVAPVAAAAPKPAEPAAAASPSFALVLAFALLGGLILNLMPCVFPVLSIKAVSVMESRRGDPAAERAHALAYTAGVVASCVAAAIALSLLRSGGSLLGWGFQMQSPVSVAVLADLMFLLGLSMSGVVQFGTGLMGVGQGLAEKGGYAGSFFTGVLAVVVASPCTAPFMGTALGFALTQPVYVAVLVFAALGVGLALPFLLLGFFPALGERLPRPGAWMETFKQFMAFPLYLSAVWLLWVLGRQSSVDAVALALCGLVALGFGAWLWGSAERSPLRTGLALVAFAAAAAALAHPVLRAGHTEKPQLAATAQPLHESFSEERLAALRAQGKPVFVNFTADWCITCKVNERVVFEDEGVKKAVADAGITWMTADWTNPDPAITAALARFGRSGVPLYVMYPARGEPEVLPQILTPALMIDAITKASQARG